MSRVRCGQELPWQAVKRAREQELRYLREIGVHEKVDEHAAVAKYNITPIDESEAIAQKQVTPVDTQWVHTDQAFEGGTDANPFADCCQRIQERGQASHSPEFPLMHVNVSRALSVPRLRGLCW